MRFFQILLTDPGPEEIQPGIYISTQQVSYLRLMRLRQQARSQVSRPDVVCFFRHQPLTKREAALRHREGEPQQEREKAENRARDDADLRPGGFLQSRPHPASRLETAFGHQEEQGHYYQGDEPEADAV